jgi:hypothetical protein
MGNFDKKLLTGINMFIAPITNSSDAANKPLLVFQLSDNGHVSFSLIVFKYFIV